MKINFHTETNFELDTPELYREWLQTVIRENSFLLGALNYIFCDDEYLLKLNQEHLDHDTYTDIISFDYSSGKEVSGDIYISIERVRDNAKIYEEGFHTELKRVMAHGVLHLMGYKDKTDEEAGIMRDKEVESIKMFHVEQ